MQANVVELTKDLVAIPSPSTISNAAIADYLATQLSQLDFDVERLAYTDAAGEKVSLVAKRGKGSGGVGLFSHSDTVPGDPGAWEPFTPSVQEGRLVGRGSCDMKGPLAATIAAAAQIEASRLRKPLFIVVTADEEVGYGGAYQVLKESQLLRDSWPTHGVVAEPTRMRPVYAHKGGLHITVTAHGTAAHTSTERGVSANFLIAPFLAEMAELRQLFLRDARFQNREFDPPTNGFNMVLNDGNCKSNVTAAKTEVTLSIRTMPHDQREEAVKLIMGAAQKYNLTVQQRGFGPFYVAPTAEIVQIACKATGVAQAETVPFGTEALVYQDVIQQQVVLGPGDIAQAHTVGEWIDVTQLEQAVGIYRRIIDQVCM